MPRGTERAADDAAKKERALKLRRETDLPTKEIALEVGVYWKTVSAWFTEARRAGHLKPLGERDAPTFAPPTDAEIDDLVKDDVADWDDLRIDRLITDT